MVRVAVCDDDPYILNQMREWLFRIADQMEMQIESDFYQDGSEILDGIKADRPYHLIFMDVEMSEVDGLYAARRIREMDKRVLIVYISNHRDHAVDSFAAKPLTYLVKPLTWECFMDIFQQSYEEILKYRQDFVFATERKTIHLPIRDILYFRSSDKRVEAVLETEVRDFVAKLDEVEKRLRYSDYPFIRIHKSYLINYCHIERKTPDEVSMSDGTVLQISRRMRAQADQQYGRLVCWMRGH